jgi:hypothetical protein
MRNLCKSSIGDPEGPFGNLRRGLEVIERDLKQDMNKWTRFIWLRIGTGSGSCEHGNGPSGSIKTTNLLLALPHGVTSS